MLVIKSFFFACHLRAGMDIATSAQPGFLLRYGKKTTSFWDKENLSEIRPLCLRM